MGRRYQDPERAGDRQVASPPSPGAAGLVGAAELGLGGALRPDAPRLPRRPASLLLWHRERWHVLEGRVVPALGQLVLQAGVARVRQRKDGSFDVADALAHKAKRGWTLVPLDVDGPGTSYLWRPIPGVTLSRWERTHAGSSVVTTDVPAYADWCESLVTRGVVPPPPPYVVEDLAARWRTEVLRLEDLSQAHPSARPDLERARGILRVVEHTLDRLSAPLVGPDEGGALDLDTLTAARPPQEP